MYIAIAGNIGAGKSTLTRLLAQQYALEPVFEAVDENPYLEDFYKDMRGYAFHSQMFFLAKRLKQHIAQVNPGGRIVQDRTIYEDAAIFARNLYQTKIMSERDFKSYSEMYSAIVQTLRPPDLLIYLQASLDTLKKRIALRGRAYEHSISSAYLTELNDLYESWIAGYDLSDVLIINADETDFLNEASDVSKLMAQLERYGLTPPVL